MRRVPTTAIFLVMLFVPTLTGSRAYGQIPSEEAATLRGLSEVFFQLHIENANDAASLGLDFETLKSDLEAKLQIAGIQLRSNKEMNEPPGTPTLYVHVKVLDGATAVAIATELHQDVALQRNGRMLLRQKGEVFRAITWHDWSVVSYPTPELIRTRIEGQLDNFKNDWFSVNPKN